MIVSLFFLFYTVIRTVLYLSGATSIQINGMSNVLESGRTTSHPFPPGITLSGALSTARGLNKNSHVTGSHNRILLETLEKARRTWFSRKRGKKKRGTNAGPLLFAAMSTFARPAKVRRISPSKTIPSPSPLLETSSPTDVTTRHISHSPNEFNGKAPEGGRPRTQAVGRKKRNKSLSPGTTRLKNRRPSTTPHGWQPSKGLDREEKHDRVVDTPRAREQLGSTGGTISDRPTTSDLLAGKGSVRSPSVGVGISVRTTSVLPGNYAVSPNSVASPNSITSPDSNNMLSENPTNNHNNQDNDDDSNEAIPGYVPLSPNVSRGRGRTRERNTSPSMRSSRSPMGRKGGAAGMLVEFGGLYDDDEDKEEEYNNKQEHQHLFEARLVKEEELDEQKETLRASENNSYFSTSMFEVDGVRPILERKLYADILLHRVCMKIIDNQNVTHYAAINVIERTPLVSDATPHLFVSATLALPLTLMNEVTQKTMTTQVSGMVLARILSNGSIMSGKPLPLSSKIPNENSVCKEIAHLCMLVEHETRDEWMLVLRVPEKDDFSDEEYETNSSRPNSRGSSRIGSRPSSRTGTRPGSSRPGSRNGSRPQSRGRPPSRDSSRPKSRESSRPKSRETIRPRSRESSRPKSRESSRPRSRESSRPKSRDRHQRGKKHHKKKVPRARRRLNKKLSQLAGRISSHVDRSQPMYIIINRDEVALEKEQKTMASPKNSTPPASPTSLANSASPASLRSNVYHSPSFTIGGRSNATTTTTTTEISTQTISFDAGQSPILLSVEALGGHPGSAIYLKKVVIPQCAICGGDLKETEIGKRIGRFDVPVCLDCSPPTPRRGLHLAPVVLETTAVLSGMEVDIFVRSYGPGQEEGVRFEAIDVLSANRNYDLETSEIECLHILRETNKIGNLQIPTMDNSNVLDPNEIYNLLLLRTTEGPTEYWRALLSALRLRPGTDRRTKVLDLKGRKPKRPKRARKTRSKSPPKKSRSTSLPPTGLDAGESITSVGSMGSGGSMDSGASFDFRISSLHKAKRAAKAEEIRRHEVQVKQDQEDTHGDVIFSTAMIKLKGIKCSVDVRHTTGSEHVFFHATDETFKDYYLHTTIETCTEKLIQHGVTSPGEKYTSTMFQVFVERLLWLEQVSITERRAKKLTLNRPRRKQSKLKSSDRRKVRSLSPIKFMRTKSMGIIPAKIPKILKTRSSMGADAYRQHQQLARKKSSVALIEHEEDLHEKRKQNHGPIVMTREAKMAGFDCTVDVRNVEGSNNIYFHVKDELLKEYDLSTTLEECKKNLEERGWKYDENDELFDLLPIFIKRLLTLEQKSMTERRAKKLTLNQAGPRRRRVTLRKSRSMSPVSKQMKMEINKETNEAAQKAKREIIQAEIRALEHAAILKRGQDFGPICYEKTMKLNGIICAVQVRYKEEGAKLLFHATDDCLCEYELPSTVTGCLTTMSVRGKRMSKNEFNVHEMVEMFVRYLLWLEPVDETERRVKRISLNRPPRKEVRLKMNKISTAGNSPSLMTGERKVLQRMNIVQSMLHTSKMKRLSLPTIMRSDSIKNKSWLEAQTGMGEKKTLAQLEHTIRSIEYEITVFGEETHTAYRLSFVCYDPERNRTFKLRVSLQRAVHALTDGEAATLIADNHATLHLEGKDGAPPNLKEMKKIYTSMDALRLYVDALDVEKDSNGGTGGTLNEFGLVLVLLNGSGDPV